MTRRIDDRDPTLQHAIARELERAAATIAHVRELVADHDAIARPPGARPRPARMTLDAKTIRPPKD